jgi:hypothetical protein
MTRRWHDLYADVAAQMRADPTLSANEIDRRLRKDGRGRNRNDALLAVRTLRTIPGVAQSALAPVGLRRLEYRFPGAVRGLSRER